jgi:hypothetical protein
MSRLNQLVKESTLGYKNYELDKATRPIADFIEDVSVWGGEVNIPPTYGKVFISIKPFSGEFLSGTT